MENEKCLNCLPVQNQVRAALFILIRVKKNGISCRSFQYPQAGIAALPYQSEPCLF